MSSTTSQPPEPPLGWVPFRDLPSRRCRVEPPAVDLSALLPKLPAPVEGETAQGICRVCAAAFPARRFRFGGTEVACTVCADCADAPIVDADRPDPFLLEVPPRYASTDMNHGGLHAEFLRMATAWRPGADGKGLGFSGPTGMGKTRCLCFALRQAAANALSIGFCSALDLAKLAADQFADDTKRRMSAQQRLQHLQTCRVLLLDDIGQEKLTERVASTFSDLIEQRVTYLRPILWTTQFSREQLVARLGVERGTAIIRRLCDPEFTQTKRLE